MNRGAVAVMAAGLVAACSRAGPPMAGPPLEAAAQLAAAEKLGGAFNDVCLIAADARSATLALEARGWPSFGVVWNQPGNVFYAAKPSPQSPAGLFVIGEPNWQGTRTYALTCVGHYPALGDAPMVQALETRWGASRDGPSNIPAGRAWRFRLADAPLPEAVAAPPAIADVAALRSGEALAYGQVSFNAPLHDVASLVVVHRRAR